MDEDFKVAQQALAIGANYQAFEIFFMMEQANTDSNFINCCRMAMRGSFAQSIRPSFLTGWSTRSR
ncbi:MAG: hypothetical protein ACO3QJ_06545 [Burkholderiaceae bacterium]